MGLSPYQICSFIDGLEGENRVSVYLIGFATSVLILKAANKIMKNQRAILILVALIIPCLIAGMRDKSVGTDVQVYLLQMTNAAINATGFSDYMNSSWYMIWRYLSVSDYEIGFSFVVYIVARIFKNIHAVQFVIQGLVVGPICYSLYRNNKIKDNLCWIGILTYYFMFYNTSLNAMRQSIAMAFVFLAFTYFENNHLKKCIFFTIIAVLFHTSAILGCLIYVVYKYVNAEHNKSICIGTKTIDGENVNMLKVIIIGFLVIAGIEIIGKVLMAVGLSKYAGYISGTVRFMPNQIISRLPALLLLIYAKRDNKDFTEFRFYFTMLFFDLLMAQFTSVNSFAGRIGLYFSIFEIQAFPLIYDKSRRKIIVFMCLIGYMLFYWWFYYVLNGANATVPYILGV